MCEGNVTEQERKGDAAQGVATPGVTTSDVADAMAAVVTETVKFVDTVGKALLAAAQDMSSLMVIKVDTDTREHLDLLVNAGAAKSRRDAAATLLVEGIQAKETTFDRIQQTQAQIKELRQQIHSLVKAQSA